MQIIHIPAFNDNYIWLIKELDSVQCCVVDPGDHQVVLERIAAIGWQLSSILLTHHHADHIGGVTALLEAFPDCQVYAPQHPSSQARYNFPLHAMADGDEVRPLGLKASFSVMAVPGHTLDHIAYYHSGHLFIGDTLFSAGCGRMFEGKAEQMHHSLSRIKQLPANTQIYCAHEYTLANLQFALAVEPKNQTLLAYQQQVSKLRQQGLPSIPTELALQLEVNPFLRCEQLDVRNAASMHAQQALSDEVATFAALRAWKDQF